MRRSVYRGGLLPAMVLLLFTGTARAGDDPSAATPPAELPTPENLTFRPSAELPFPLPHDTFETGDPILVSCAVPAETVADLYLVRARTAAEYRADPTLVDARASGPRPVTLAAGDSAPIPLTGTDALPRTRGDRAGCGYDVVLDLDRDGKLGAGDRIDGARDPLRDPGLFLLGDLNDPGPRAVRFVEHRERDLYRIRLHFPETIAPGEELPLVVVAHGFTHRPEDYDFIGRHLAACGVVVMAHDNDVGRGNARGTESAARSTLSNIDFLLGHLDEVADGVLDGHVDPHRMMWIGHSTGGECIVRAHRRLRHGESVPPHFGADDVRVLVPVCPVSFLPADRVTPLDVPLHMFIGGADTDTSGAPVTGYPQSLSIFERATGPRSLTVVRNTGHEWFHGRDGGRSLASGPDLADRAAVHTIELPILRALTEVYLFENLAARDLLTRSLAQRRPVGVDSRLQLTSEFHDGDRAPGFVIDDFEAEDALERSSSGAVVRLSVVHAAEVAMLDRDGSFEWTGHQPSNGLTRGHLGSDAPRCLVFDWAPSEDAEEPTETSAIFQVRDDRQDRSRDSLLCFRAGQLPRHPNTVALDGPLAFGVALADADGRSAVLPAHAFGSFPPPYPREGYGPGAGWGAEFTSVRIPLETFRRVEPGLDLTRVETVRFLFGGSHGSERGRIALDDIRFLAGDRAPRRAAGLRFLEPLPRHLPADALTQVRLASFGDVGDATVILHCRFDDSPTVHEFECRRVDPHTWETALPPGEENSSIAFWATLRSPSRRGTEPLAFAPAGAPSVAFRRPVAHFVTVVEVFLDEDPGWSRTGGWAFGIPEGKGGGPERGNPDPTSGRTGQNVIGIDLGGDHPASREPHTLIAGPFDLSGIHAATLTTARWLNCDARRWCRATIDVSTDRERWTTVWRNGDANIEDDRWVEHEVEIGAVADGAPEVWVRFDLRLRTEDAWRMSGWNIDDLRIHGVRRD